MTTLTASADGLRHRMVQQLCDEGALRSPQWREAFEAVPREAFVSRFTVRANGELVTFNEGDPGFLEAVYSNRSLNTQYNQHGTATSSSSQPAMMAIMAEALAPASDTLPVLDLGTGPGYNAALLCHRYGSHRVVSRDVDPTLVAAAADHLSTTVYTPRLSVGDGAEGCPEHAPYGALIATYGVGRIPRAWREQVVRGGSVVANIGYGLVSLTIGDGGAARGRFLPTVAAFMHARPSADAAPPPARAYAGQVATAEGSQHEIELRVDLGEEMPSLLGSLAHPDVIQFSVIVEGEQVCGLVHPDSGSWARITPRNHDTAQLDHGGPRDLWAERAPLIRGWVEAGQPGAEAYSLTVHQDGRHELALGEQTWALP